MRDGPEQAHRYRIIDQFTRQAEPFLTAPAIRNEDALQRVVRLSRAGPDDNVLDVACGPGLLACAFAPAVHRVTGVDITPAMVSQARLLQREKSLVNISCVIAEASPLPFRDGEFSIVTSRFAFHHFPDPAAVLREMRRVCRAGGCVVVADVTPLEEKAAAFNAMERLRDPSHARALPLEELLGLFSGVGLRAPTLETYRLEGDLDDLLRRSFPEAGGADLVRQMFEESLTKDTLGLAARREKDRICFGYPITIAAARA